MFCTWAARAVSLNALGAVAGAGVSVILGVVVLGADSFGAYFSSDAVSGVEMLGIKDDDSDVGAVTEKYACRFDAFIVLGPGPESDGVDATGLGIAAAGVVVPAALEGRGNI